MVQPLLFTPIQIRDIILKNRIVVAPMHQYAAIEGYATDWHLVNAGKFAVGGCGLVMVESTKVERRGCGILGDLGIWHDDHVAGHRWLADFIRAQNAVPARQIGHSGRKARRYRLWEGGKPLQPGPGMPDFAEWELVSASAITDGGEDEPLPRALSRDEILQRGQTDLVALTWGLMYNPNWTMDAAQKFGVDPRFEIMPSTVGSWLSKRLGSAKTVEPSNYRKGVREPA